jgi:hypothetical protein
MSGDLSGDEIREKIEVGSANWRDIVPNEKRDWFVGRVQEAVRLYLSLVSPKDLRDELEGFEKATRSPTAPIGQLVSGLSEEAQSILSRSGPLPLPPNDPSATEEYYNEIRSRLLRGQRWKAEGDKRRKKIDIVGPPRRMGRPPAEKIDVLVSFISSAYAAAVGKPVTRSWTDEAPHSWSEEAESAVEKIVEDVFESLGINKKYSAKKAVQRHVKERTYLNIRH